LVFHSSTITMMHGPVNIRFIKYSLLIVLLDTKWMTHLKPLIFCTQVF